MQQLSMGGNTYIYRLSFLQVLMNPPLVFILRVFAAVIVITMFRSAVVEYRNWQLWLATAMLILVSWWCLYAGYGPWLRHTKTLEFTKEGITGVGPYPLLRIYPGLLRTWIIKSHTGHFLIVPRELLSRSDVETLIRAHKLTLGASSFRGQQKNEDKHNQGTRQCPK